MQKALKLLAAFLYSRVNLTICCICGWDWPPFVSDTSNCGDQMKFKQGKMWVTNLQAAHNLGTQTNKHPRGIYFYSKVMRILQPSKILWSEHFSSGILLPQRQMSTSQSSPMYTLYPATTESHQWEREVTVLQIFNYKLFFWFPQLFTKEAQQAHQTASHHLPINIHAEEQCYFQIRILPLLTKQFSTEISNLKETSSLPASK